MARILVAGGTGALGAAVVNGLKSAENDVRVMSRRPAPASLERALEWAQADIISGAGLEDALAEVDTVVNCAGDPRNAYETDVLGVKRLAEAANQAGVTHFFHISIAGIDHIDLEYYRYKLKAETAVIESGVPYSIQRLTQFHTLLDFMLAGMQKLSEGYVLPVAGDARFQLTDTRDVAAYIAPLVFAKPGGRLPDAGGPEILRVDEIARIYLDGQGVSDPAFIDPEEGFFPPEAVEGFRQGLNTVPNNRFGQITWAAYVRERNQQDAER